VIATIAVSGAAVICVLIAAWTLKKAMEQGYQITGGFKIAKQNPPARRAAEKAQSKDAEGLRAAS
jgi:hypothetical protein